VIRGTSSPDIGGATLPAGSAALAGRSPHAFAGATTLSTGTGERHVVAAPVVRSSGSRRLLFGAIAVAGLATAVAAGLRRISPSPAQAPVVPVAAVPTGGPVAPSPPAAAEALVRLTIDSRPPGAQVVDVDSGQAVGLTPAVLARPASDRPVTVRVEKVGFVAVTRAFPVDKDRTEVIVLSAAVVADPSGIGAAAGSSSGRSQKTSLARPKKPARPKHAPPPPPKPDDEPAKL
jgi:hypothetical protein